MSCLVGLLCSIITVLIMPWGKVGPLFGAIMATAVFYIATIWCSIEMDEN